MKFFRNFSSRNYFKESISLGKNEKTVQQFFKGCSNDIEKTIKLSNELIKIKSNNN